MNKIDSLPSATMITTHRPNGLREGDIVRINKNEKGWKALKILFIRPRITVVKSVSTFTITTAERKMFWSEWFSAIRYALFPFTI